MFGAGEAWADPAAAGQAWAWEVAGLGAGGSARVPQGGGTEGNQVEGGGGREEHCQGGWTADAVTRAGAGRGLPQVKGVRAAGVGGDPAEAGGGGQLGPQPLRPRGELHQWVWECAAGERLPAQGRGV